jgi:hypothetical protein
MRRLLGTLGTWAPDRIGEMPHIPSVVDGLLQGTAAGG